MNQPGNINNRKQVSLIPYPEDALIRFQEAIFNKDLSTLEAILEVHPGLIEELEADGSSLLHRLMGEFPEAMPLLLSHGANIEALDSSGFTPL